MLDNAAYQGSIDYPYSVTQPPPGYNGVYEIVEPQASTYHRLQWPTQGTATGVARSGASPDMTIASPTGTASTTVTSVNPPPLPMARRGLIPKPVNISNGETSLDCAFQAKSLETVSPCERGRVDSTSLLLPPEKLGSSKSSPDFEGLYSQCYENAPNNPGLRHPLQNIPETGALFPEPENPNPFPTYQTIPAVPPGGNTPDSSVTLPVLSSAKLRSPPQPMDRGTARNPPHNLASCGPVYHSLEDPNIDSKEGTPDTPQQLPALDTGDTADYTAGSESSISAFTPSFPSSIADVSADSAGRGSQGHKMIPKPQHNSSSDHMTDDVTGDSDFPNRDAADYSSGGSAVYPEGPDWTAGNSARNLNDMAYNHTANGTVYALPQLSKTLPSKGSNGVGNLDGPVHHTMDSSMNHYKQLDPATMEPHLKYAPLNVTLV